MWHNALEAASRKGMREGIHWGMALIGALVVFLLFGLLVNRLYDLQIARHDEYAALAERNYLRTEPIQGYRGMLKDRRGAVLAENRPSLNAYVYPHDVRDPEGEVKLLTRLLSLSPREQETLLSDMAQGASGSPRERVLLRQDLPREEVALLEARHLDLPGIRVEPSTKRYYPLGGLASHLIGYMKEVSPDEIESLGGYEPGDLIGRSGVERAYESVLRGKKGWRREVRDFRENVQPKEISSRYYLGEAEQDPVPGSDVILTLDAEFERATEVAFRGYRSGAAVVLEVKTGRVLSMLSKPGYDLNEIANGLTSKEKSKLDKNPDSPWLNKALEAYPPGSTFKVITAIAALETGVKPKDQVYCDGEYELGEHPFRCHGEHGYVDLKQAIARSCDTYFYTRSVEFGIDTLAKYGALFGLGESTGLGLGADRTGIMPSKSWYEKERAKARAEGKTGRIFSPGMTVNASIGQGDVLTTPLQLAILYAAIANGGTVFTPQLVERVEDVDGRTISSFSPKIRRVVDLAPGTLEVVREGLEAVVQTGTLAKVAEDYQGYRVAGKTGTAQVRGIGKVRKAHRDMAYYSRHHAWVAAYAPSDDPKIAVVVFVEHGGGGGTAAGPVAMEIISRYFDIFGAEGAASLPAEGEAEPASREGSSGAPSRAPPGLSGGLPLGGVP